MCPLNCLGGLPQAGTFQLSWDWYLAWPVRISASMGDKWFGTLKIHQVKQNVLEQNFWEQFPEFPKKGKGENR